MVRYGIQTTEYTKRTKWIRIYNSRKVRNVRKGCGAFPKKNFADFARGKKIRTLFYTFLHVLHGQKFNRLFVYLVYFVVIKNNNKTRKEKLQ